MAGIKSRTSSILGQTGLFALELPALESRKLSPYTYIGEDVVNTTAPSFLIGSSLNLQIRRTGIKYQKSLILGQVGLYVLELLALERKNFFPYTYNGENVVDTIAPSFFIGPKRCLCPKRQKRPLL